ncbi:unnamed protein product [Symbiodinium sp. CCMP2592]|nr:unnamed protein product [Symbiodinium sp. CCMP2592]
MSHQLAMIPQPQSVLRKDKYEKKLLWYYCDVAYEGAQATKDEEELVRDTTICDGAPVTDVPFGLGSALPNLDSEEEDDDDDEDDEDDEEEDEEPEEPKKKLARKKSKESQHQEDPDEATCCPQIAFNVKAANLQKQIDELGSKHDELADMKSAYDCEEKIDFSMPDSKKPR